MPEARVLWGTPLPRPAHATPPLLEPLQRLDTDKVGLWQGTEGQNFSSAPRIPPLDVLWEL